MQHKSDEAAQRLAQDVWDSCLGSRVTRLHRLLSLRYDQALAEVGLTLPQVEILAALVMRARAVRPAEMGRNLVVGRSAMSRKLAALQDRGWVETVERSESGRSMSFVITPAGRDMLAAASQAWRRVQAETERQLGPGAVVEVDAWLARLDSD
ncbi:MarR family winged helix-turn-helix transcriptional regulator [soil metagenome]